MAVAEVSVVPCRKPLAARCQCSGRPGELLKVDVVVSEENTIQESSVASHICAYPAHYCVRDLKVNNNNNNTKIKL